jgi:hypothetical protein
MQRLQFVGYLYDIVPKDQEAAGERYATACPQAPQAPG